MDDELKVYALVAVIGTIASAAQDHRLVTVAIARCADILEDLQTNQTPSLSGQGLQ